MVNALLWNLTLTAGLAIVLTALCRFPSMHKRPALRHLLWLLLLAKLITPPLIGVPLLPAIVGSDNTTATPPSVPTGGYESALDQRTRENVATGDATFAFVGEGAGRDEREAARRELRSGTQMPYVGGLFAVSLIGTCVLLIVHGVRAAKLCRWLKRAGTEDSLLAESCALVASSLEIRGVVRSCVVNARMAPLLWAWHRPLVVVPRQLVDDLDPQQLRSIIAHELAHFLRRDHWTNVFAFMVKVLLWWNPVVWWADRELRAAQELCCDAIAIDRCKANRRSYATTLLTALDLIQAEPSSPHEFAPGMGSRTSILRRFEMIGETQLSYRLSRWTLLVLLILAIPLVCIPVRAQGENPALLTPPAVVAEEGEGRGKSLQGFDHVNASPLDEAGVYHISPIFKKLVKVTVVKRGGPYGLDHTRTLEDWNYDKKTGRFTVKETVDNEKEMVVVYGKRKVPWAWQMQSPISNVKVLIGTEAAIRGQDYKFDGAAGTVRFLKREHCREGVHYHISYGYRDEPSKSGSIGNHPDQTLVRKFLGLHPTPDKDADIGKSIGTNASRTDNPMVWTMTQSMRSDSVKVGLGRRSVKDALDWLERRKDFAYDETLATITLLREIPLEEDSWMFVSGVPRERGRFLFHSKLTKGQVNVILGNRLLEEGVGYEVDYKQGIVTILDNAIEKSGAKYFISAGGRSMGNHSNTALVQKLLGTLVQKFLGTTESVLGTRPRGNCSISGKVVSEETGNPIENARMYLFDNKTFGSIFIRTAADGTFTFKDIPTGPFSLQSSHTAGYQDVGYNPEGKLGYHFIPFSLKDGERRTGIVLKAKRAYQISGKIVDENGEVPEDIQSLSVMAWVERDDGTGYRSKQAIVNRADGSYSIDGLGDRPAYVMANDWRAAKKADPYPPIYYPSTFSRNDAKQITFGEKRLVDNVNITLRKEGGLVLEGTVTDRETGAPVPKTLITVHHVDMLFDRVTAYTDKNGVYRVRGLGPGEFAVHVDASPRGYVRTRKLLNLSDEDKTKSMDVSVRAGVSIHGKFVDQHGKDMDIYENAYGLAFAEGYPTPETNSWSGTDNRYAPTDVFGRLRVTFNPDEGDYEEEYMIFPTKRSFVIPAMNPGKKKLRFHPKSEDLSSIRILRGGTDISQTGIELIAGEEVKNVVIMIGPSKEKVDADAP